MERMWSSSSFCHIVKFSEWKGPWCRCKNLQKCCGGFLWSTAERSKSWATGAKSCHIKRDTLYGWTCFWNDHFQAKIRDSGLRRFMEDRSWKSPSSAAKFRAALRGSAAKVATSEASCSRGGTLDVMAEKKHFVPVRFLEKPFQYQVLSWTFTISLSILFHFLPQACFSSDVPGPSFQSFGDFSCWPGKAAEGTGAQQRTAGKTANLRGPIMEIPWL